MRTELAKYNGHKITIVGEFSKYAISNGHIHILFRNIQLNGEKIESHIWVRDEYIINMEDPSTFIWKFKKKTEFKITGKVMPYRKFKKDKLVLDYALRYVEIEEMVD